MADTKEQLTQSSTPDVPKRSYKGRHRRTGDKTGSENRRAPQVNQGEVKDEEEGKQINRGRIQREPRSPREKKAGLSVTDGIMDVRLWAAQPVFSVVNRIKLAFCGKDMSGNELPKTVDQVRISALGSAIPRVVVLNCKLDEVCERDSVSTEIVDNCPKLTLTLRPRESWNREEWVKSFGFQRGSTRHS